MSDLWEDEGFGDGDTSTRRRRRRRRLGRGATRAEADADRSAAAAKRWRHIGPPLPDAPLHRALRERNAERRVLGFAEVRRDSGRREVELDYCCGRGRYETLGAGLY
jgi:hypothetical protein